MATCHILEIFKAVYEDRDRWYKTCLQQFNLLFVWYNYFFSAAPPLFCGLWYFFLQIRCLTSRISSPARNISNKCIFKMEYTLNLFQRRCLWIFQCYFKNNKKTENRRCIWFVYFYWTLSTHVLYHPFILQKWSNSLFASCRLMLDIFTLLVSSSQ